MTKMDDAKEPVSPATRRTNNLFGLSGLIAAVGAAALAISTASQHDRHVPFWSALFPNRAISPGIALFAIACWLLSIAIAWWWYFSADEHERRANDVGHLVGGGLFMAATPVWWVAARAGLVPQPDAMVLWLITVSVTTIGWFWHRSR